MVKRQSNYQAKQLEENVATYEVRCPWPTTVEVLLNVQTYISSGQEKRTSLATHISWLTFFWHMYVVYQNATEESERQ